MVFLGQEGITAPVALHFSLPATEASPLRESFEAVLPDYARANDTDPKTAKIVLVFLSRATFEANPPVWFDEADYTEHVLTQEVPVLGWNGPVPRLETQFQNVLLYVRDG
jgi:hypothetical protein